MGPKRATKIRRLFNLTKEDDVRKFVLRKTVVPKDAEGKPKEGAKARSKAPKIQRLVTPARLQRKRRVIAQKKQRRVKNREELASYQKLLAKYAKVGFFVKIFLIYLVCLGTFGRKSCSSSFISLWIEA